jgi:antitoxin FitA
MRSACYHVAHMKMIQIRNVPDELHRSLKARAAREGRTLSDLILSDLPRLAERPSPEQVMSRIRSRSSVGGPPASELIAAERDRR